MAFTILAVDDEVSNLRLIKGFLAKSGFNVITAEDGVQAWKTLKESPTEIDLLLTDRMMPNMDGMELITKVKQHPEMKNIPIIMQTASAQKEQVIEGFEAGVYYYLTKPFDAMVLVSIINAALADVQAQEALYKEVVKYKKIQTLVKNCTFYFSSLEDVQSLTVYLANFFPEPDRVAMGISELLINAVEHGLLGITYDEKSELNNKGKWYEEIKIREELPENIHKKILVSHEKTDTEISLVIKDGGYGFNWKKYMELDAERATDNHGRGIAMSNSISFDTVEYRGNGNEVCCKVKLCS
jgi:DNA-binding response OmpR family regulator/anti-sigma regulatory factor (Ser/Thr protein kinase)